MDLRPERAGPERPVNHFPRFALVAVAAALALIAAACGGDDAPEGVLYAIDGDTTVVVANSPGTLTTNGEQRVLVALVGTGPNEFVGGDDQSARIEFNSVDGDGQGVAVGEWVSNPGVALGLYVTAFTFEEPGLWNVNLEGADGSLAAALIEVSESSTIPDRGSPAPPSITPTGSSLEEITSISTDPDPNPDFYSLTVAEAVGNGRPTVIVFATPAFCRTAICGPTVEIVKDIATDRSSVDFVHVEPFEIEAAQAGSLVPIEPMFDWGLVTEPWIFVVDDAGNVAASFEGIIGQAELERAIDGL